MPSPLRGRLCPVWCLPGRGCVLRRSVRAPGPGARTGGQLSRPRTWSASLPGLPERTPALLPGRRRRRSEADQRRNGAVCRPDLGGRPVVPLPRPHGSSSSGSSPLVIRRRSASDRRAASRPQASGSRASFCRPPLSWVGGATRVWRYPFPSSRPKGFVDGAEGEGPGCLPLQLLPNRDAVGILSQPQDRQQNQQLELSRVPHLPPFSWPSGTCQNPTTDGLV